MPTNKFLLDTSRCIRCTGCEAACKQFNEVPKGIRRLRVVTINDGKPGETNVPMPCMHCTKPPCLSACPVAAIYKREDGIVLVKLRLRSAVEAPVSRETVGEPPTPTGLDGNNKVTSYQGVTNKLPHTRDGIGHFPVEPEGGSP